MHKFSHWRDLGFSAGVPKQKLNTQRENKDDAYLDPALIHL